MNRLPLSEISSTEAEFREAVPDYEKALKESGHTHTLKYIEKTPAQPENENENRNVNGDRKKKTKIIWFNPPFSRGVSTNIGKIFLKMIDKHFPKRNQLHKVFNRNTVKISYSCTRNMKMIIQAHNKKILNKRKRRL